MQIASTSEQRKAPPLVSVVMVACNVERFLAEAIDSILAQTYSNFEFIIVDFGSTDGSKAIAAGYAAKNERIEFHEIPHCGLPEARNAACSFAKGKYAAIMDADDVARPERLALQVEFLESHPQVKALGGAVEWIDTNGTSLMKRENPPGNSEIQAALSERCPLWHPSVMISLDAFRQVGGYRAPFVVAQDYDLWLRIAERFELANLDDVVLQYRLHSSQVSVRRRKQQTLCVLAAQLSASCRRRGAPDPLDSTEQITPEKLLSWGVSQCKLQNSLAADYRDWIRNICMAGERSAAIQATREILNCNLKYVERWRVAEFYLTIARLYWQNKNYVKSFAAGAHAVLTRPIMLGRPLKPLLHRLGLA